MMTTFAFFVEIDSRIDFVRLITILLLVAVVCVYAKTVMEMTVGLIRNRPNMPPFVFHLNLGRIFGSLGVVILALTVIEGHVIRWGFPLSVRVPLSIVAALALLWGWYNSSRFVFKADAPAITKADLNLKEEE